VTPLPWWLAILAFLFVVGGSVAIILPSARHHPPVGFGRMPIATPRPVIEI
jgi:hypothetical protein